MAEKILFKAKIEHNEDTIEKMYVARYNSYEKLRAISRPAIGLVMVFVAAFANVSNIFRALLLLVGAWLLVSGDFPAQIKADRVMQARHGSVPEMKYEFYSSEMRIIENGQSKNMKYGKIARLVTDFDYFYLFFSKDSCCMVDRKTIGPGTDEELAALLADKSGAEWRQDRPLLSMNFYNIRNMIRDRRKK